MHADRNKVPGPGQHFDDSDEVKEEAADGSRNSNPLQPLTAVQNRGQRCDATDAVEDSRDSQP